MFPVLLTLVQSFLEELVLGQDQVICILRFRTIYFCFVSSPWDADYAFLTNNVEHLSIQFDFLYLLLNMLYNFVLD